MICPPPREMESGPSERSVNLNLALRIAEVSDREYAGSVFVPQALSDNEKAKGWRQTSFVELLLRLAVPVNCKIRLIGK